MPVEVYPAVYGVKCDNETCRKVLTVKSRFSWPSMTEAIAAAIAAEWTVTTDYIGCEHCGPHPAPDHEPCSPTA